MNKNIKASSFLITNWSEVGGSDMPIVLFVRDEGDSSTTALREFVVSDAVFDESAQVLTSQGDMQTAVAAGTNVTPIGIDGVAPTDPDYEMLSTLGLGYLSEHQSDVQALLDWLSSDSGRTRLQELALIPGE